MKLLISTFGILAATFCLAADQAVEHIDKLVTPRRGTPILLKGTERIVTKDTFRPPVEITIEAKTDSTDLRISYAAEQVIFNWRDIPHQLRVDGGPANGQHKSGAGVIPRNKYVIIRWVVLPKSQTIFVDGEKRFEHTGDYSKLDQPVSVFSDASKVSVKSIKVLKLPATVK
jgi:hypothetical protein